MEGSKRRGLVRNRFEDLEPEIVSDILSRLAIMWMVRCKCVCKTWHALIKDDNFVILESDRAQYISGKIERFMFNIEDQSSAKAIVIPTVPLADGVTNENLKIMCSFNGWICLAPENRTDPVVICNPMLSEDFIILPKSEQEKIYYQTHNITLGFDHLIHKYKAVRVLMHCYHCIYEVITIGEDTSWRPVFNNNNEIHFRVPRGGVFCQGSIYWTIDRGNIFRRTCDYPNRDIFLEFDVSKEVFQVISFPDKMRKPIFRQACDVLQNMRLQIMGGSVALIDIDVSSAGLLNIWQIVRGRNWDDRVVEYSSIGISLPSKIPRARFIALLHSNSVVDDDFLLLERPPGQWTRREKSVPHKKRRETEFLFYFPNSSSSKRSDRIRTLSGLGIHSYGNFIAWCFKPSLVSVKKDLLGQ